MTLSTPTDHGFNGRWYGHAPLSCEPSIHPHHLPCKAHAASHHLPAINLYRVPNVPAIILPCSPSSPPPHIMLHLPLCHVLLPARPPMLPTCHSAVFSFHPAEGCAEARFEAPPVFLKGRSCRSASTSRFTTDRHQVASWTVLSFESRARYIEWDRKTAISSLKSRVLVLVRLIMYRSTTDPQPV